MSGAAPFRAPAVPAIRRAPPCGRVLVIAPHPDDETMGLGGTLAIHAAQGDAITAVFVCNGIQGDPDGWFPRDRVVAMREAEAREAAKVLGISELRFLGYPDNLSDADIHVFEGLPDAPDDARRALADGFAARLAAMLDAEPFTIVYHPWDGELNPDHWLVGQGVSRLRRSRPDLEARVSFLGYDVWTALPPEVVIDTSEVIERKLEAVRCYKSQLFYVDYEHAVLGLDAYRSLLLERGATYGEAFAGRYLGA
jgi:LmbE family N-acetylglucosaminyl deacetylase